MIFGIIALIVIVLIVLWGVSAYNGLVTLITPEFLRTFGFRP